MKLLAFIGLSLIGTISWANTVAQVRDKRVLLNITQGNLQVGQDVTLLQDGKRLGVVTVRQVRGKQAVAEIKSGRAVKGARFQPLRAGTATAGRGSPGRTNPTQKVDFEDPKWTVGVMASFSQNSMSFTAQQGSGGTLRSADVTFTGNSFGVRGIVDYDWSPSITIRAAAAYEPFNANGTANSTVAATLGQPICNSGTSSSCEVSFTYMGLEGTAQYNYINSSSWRGWVGLGYSFLLTMSKSINVPNLQSAGATNQMVLFSTGADLMRTSDSYVPVSFEYGYIPGTNVKANAIYLRGGYAWTY
jgi:hypothetical protein